MKREDNDIKAKKNFSVRMMTFTGAMTAICCVLCPFSVPIGPVPISLGVLAAFLSVYAIGKKAGTVSILLYLLLGAIGIPVFAGFTGGLDKLVGPTGGYLLGYVAITIITGYFIDKYSAKEWYMHVIGMIIGVVACYALGTAWFVIVTGMNIIEALGICVIPFIPIDSVKIVIGYIFGTTVRRTLKATGMIEYN